MIYKISLPNIKYGYLMPAEDAFLIDDRIFCVADGVTRDPISPKDFTDRSVEEILEKYPNPSGAKLAADVFCENFTKLLKAEKRKNIKNVKNAFIWGNKAIAQLNKNHIKKVDYLVNDYFGCVASGGVVKNKKLYWGAICDCGIRVYGKSGKIKFKTSNWMKTFEIYENKYIRKKNFDWGLPKYRKLIRSEYRNNIKKNFNNKLISFGVLTGEKEAEYFMKFGEVNLTKGDLIVFYTDGFENTVKHSRFFDVIYNSSGDVTKKRFLPFTQDLAQKNMAKFGKERTLIAVICN